MENKTSKILCLANLLPGMKGKVVAVSGDCQNTSNILLEIGFHENAPVEVLHKGNLSSSPLAVRVNDSTFGLREKEAGFITVELAV